MTKTMFFAALVLLLYATGTKAENATVTEVEDFCNICGQGNFIGFQTGVVSFEYEGVQLTNNCQHWQTIVMNPVAISDDFCRNEMLMYTLPVCRCYTEGGELVPDTYEAYVGGVASNEEGNNSENGGASNGGDGGSSSSNGGGGGFGLDSTDGDDGGEDDDQTSGAVALSASFALLAASVLAMTTA